MVLGLETKMIPSKIIEKVAAVIIKIGQLAPTAIQTIEDAKPFADVLYRTLVKGEKVTQEELEALEAKIDALSNELQKPLPE